MTYFGTGFRISQKLILTNHHVLFPDNSVATPVQADFGFDVAADGTSLLLFRCRKRRHHQGRDAR